MENVDLTIRAVRAHDVLFDGLTHSDLLDELIQCRLRIFPFFGGDDFDDAGFHAVTIYRFHEGFKIFELMHGRLEDRNASRPMIGHYCADIITFYCLWLGLW